MQFPKPRFTYLLVLMVSFLLLSYLFLSQRNAVIIQQNAEIQKIAEKIKVDLTDIIRSLHLMDLGIRGYALLPGRANQAAYDSSLVYLQTAFSELEGPLAAQGFPLGDYQAFKDSVYQYVALGADMLAHLKMEQRDQFLQLYQHDHGYAIWLYYLRFAGQVNGFEDAIIQQAHLKYTDAMSRNNYVFIALLVLILPTLFYTAYHAQHTYRLSERLREAEYQKNEILSNQNLMLEQLVQARAEEIMLQNEELYRANKMIEEQNKLISERNRFLKEEVSRQTEGLQHAKLDLENKLKKIEEYAFVVSHNLRSPVARILGLSNLLNNLNDPLEAVRLQQYIQVSAVSLDRMLQDLNEILRLENDTDPSFSKVDLAECIEEVEQVLSGEILLSKACIHKQLEVCMLEYRRTAIFSIMHNLLSNAIKYRDPERLPQITIESRENEGGTTVVVRDNGLGVDLEKHGGEIFSLYRRFHTHVEGSGMGLYICRLQVEKFGGTINIKSKTGSGTSIYVHLPKVTSSNKNSSFLTGSKLE